MFIKWRLPKKNIILPISTEVLIWEDEIWGSLDIKDDVESCKSASIAND